MLDCTAALFERFVAMGLEECDGAAMIDVIRSLPRANSPRPVPEEDSARPGGTVLS
jgi:hypothetical protein